MQVSKKNYLGIDVSKLWFDVSLLRIVNHQKQPIITDRFDNIPAGIKEFKKWLVLQEVSFDLNSLGVIENTRVYHRLIWSFCSKYQLQLHIGNAAHIKWSLGIKGGKSDKIDSQRLCTYCYKQVDEMQATSVLNSVFIQIKDLMSSRSRLVTQLHNTKN